MNNAPILGLARQLALSAARNTRNLSTKKHPKPLRTKKYGIDILHDPLWNKSLAFDMSERDRLGLRGLLPPATRSLEFQVKRTMERIYALPNDVSKNLYLQDLHNRNETLYHRVLVEHVSLLSTLRRTSLTRMFSRLCVVSKLPLLSLSFCLLCVLPPSFPFDFHSI